jgi:hypothetical protein
MTVTPPDQFEPLKQDVRSQLSAREETVANEF